ncbi:hypothetical protein AsAng_0059680 [Aureispira anguillae]|uniref:Uncharacterized protein n=1 Tax=Aureispira anguillae TaxID=2864201 RepID=A0A915YLG3_9BACT|nr:hypothetical protein AsAng_0059680 [Aureispira anguillae]
MLTKDKIIAISLFLTSYRHIHKLLKINTLKQQKAIFFQLNLFFFKKKGNN